jgi:hypothetical protein
MLGVYSLQGTGKGGAKFVDSYYLETYYLGRWLAGLGGLWRTPAINSIDQGLPLLNLILPPNFAYATKSRIFRLK